MSKARRYREARHSVRLWLLAVERKPLLFSLVASASLALREAVPRKHC